MLIDLALSDKRVLVVGRGKEVRIRANQLAAEGGRVEVVTDDTTRAGLKFGKGKAITILPENLDSWKSALQSIRPFVVVVSTEDLELDEEIATFGRSLSKLVYVVDRPKLNDINMTGVAKVGDVRIAVSTQGLSPAMAGILRRKIESVIAPEDVLIVKLQGEVRGILQKTVADRDMRKKLVYRLIRDRKIISLLKSKRFETAKDRALDLIVTYSGRT